ncbi:hypothetical protein F4779DRAFT_613935 [Xylariaceae sp. FL0662B]|nr:hypothetical protein F4779DRAFT_613935 [Xylariaceae sp. FL0662B]
MSWFRSPSVILRLGSFAALANAAHFDVTVGKGGQLKFDPETLNTQVGDTVTYSFFAKNHAVAQSTFDNPCQLQKDGVFSGFTPNESPDIAAPTTFTITVNDTKPLWFYCPQTSGNHCQNGMVHAINAPPSGNTFDAYKAKAQNAATPSTPPVDTLPAGGLRKVHIDVGFDGNLVFNPNNITEPVGTVLEFGYNPANHSIVQSSFDEPCQPLESGGFAAPFFATQQTPSGVTFEVAVTDDKPIWFYCAQTTKSHCQSGMVGSINAPAEGEKTFQAFKDLAAKAPPSTIPPATPLVGTLKVNGTLVADVGGSVLNTTALDPSLIGNVPPPGSNYPPNVGGMAGGNQPAEYGWAPTITDEATLLLQAQQYITNALVSILFEGYLRLSNGKWAGVYPASITNTIGSLAAQALVYSRTFSDSLQHFSKPMAGLCKYQFQLDDAEGFVQDTLSLLTIAMGANIDAISLAAENDSWVVPALATALGSQARMAAVINMMQGHIASPAPREALLPYQLAVSYVTDKYVVPDSCDSEVDLGKALPGLVIKDKTVDPGSGRLTGITVEIPDGSSSGDHYLAWIGAWGNLKYTSVDNNGVAPVPEDLYGHVLAVLTTKKDLKARDIETAAVAGPEIVWTTQQWAAS